MNTKQQIEYLTPEVRIQQLFMSGILCSSTGFGQATTDDFEMGEDISGNF